MTNTLQQVRELIEKKMIIIPKGNIEGDLQMSCEKHNEMLQELLSEIDSLPSDDDGLLFGGGDRKAPPLPLPPSL